MNNKTQKIKFLSTILAITLLFIGCKASETNIKISTDIGTLTEQSVRDNINYISIETDKSNLSLEIERLDMFEPLTIGKKYIVAYDDNNILKSIKIVELESPIEEPTSNEISENIQSVSEFSTTDLTIVNEYDIDFDNDQIYEKIKVYVNAEKIDGEFLWDDGHRWVLLLEDSDKKYVLFDNHIQLGGLSFYAYFKDETFTISTITSGTANITLTDYIYYKESDNFSKIIKYNPEGNINMFIQPNFN